MLSAVDFHAGGKMRSGYLIVVLAASLAVASARPLAAQARGAATRPPAAPAPKPAAPPPAPAPTDPLSVSEVIEALYSLGSITRVEELVAKRGANFEATPDVVKILRDFGATDRMFLFIRQPAPPPQPVYSGPLTVTCEPSDCMVVVNDKYIGFTQSGKALVNNLAPGQAFIQVFSEGYGSKSQQVPLVEGQPREVAFLLQPATDFHERLGSQAVLDAVRGVGGLEALAVLAEFQGEGTLDWTDDKGQTQRWPLTFSKQLGDDIKMVFKTKDGECTATIAGPVVKQSCRGKLKGFESTADEAAELFLKYQLQNVLEDFLARSAPLLGNETGRRVESSTGSDTYVLTFGADKLPAGLTHAAAGSSDPQTTIRFANYAQLSSGMYPGLLEIKTSKGMNLVFTLSNLKTRVFKKA